MNDKSKTLPSWFRRPQSLAGWQIMLFKHDLPKVLSQLQVSADELARWHNNGWISFDSSIKDVEEPHIWEITFVRDIMRSGLPDAIIENLLLQLPRPLNFDPLTIAYNFSLGWVELNIPDSNEIDENTFESWLDELIDEGDTERLKNIIDMMNNFIEKVKEMDMEDNT